MARAKIALPLSPLEIQQMMGEAYEEAQRRLGAEGVKILWAPFKDSPQETGYWSKADELFYGGQAGGGKLEGSDFSSGAWNTCKRDCQYFEPQRCKRVAKRMAIGIISTLRMGSNDSRYSNTNKKPASADMNLSRCSNSSETRKSASSAGTVDCQYFYNSHGNFSPSGTVKVFLCDADSLKIAQGNHRL